MKKVFSIVIGIIFSCTSLLAQTITIKDAIDIGLKNSLDIQVLRNNKQIADINNNVGVAGGLPVITGTVADNEQVNNINQKLNSGEVIKRNGASGNTLTSSLNATIVLYNGSRIVTTKKRLEELELQSDQYVNSLVQNTVAAIMTAYYDVVRQQSYLKTIEGSIAASQKRLEIVKAQQNVGLANNADLFQSQLDLNTLLQSRQSQQLVIDQSKTQLLLLISLKPDSVIAVNDTILMGTPIVLGEVLGQLPNNADIIAADEQVKINDFLIRETAALRYPTVRANAAYNYNRNQSAGGQLLLNQSNGPTGGISIGVPIYNGSIYKRQQRVAEINSKNAELQKEILVRNYSAGAVKTYQAYINNQQQLETQKQNVELAQKLLDLVLQRYQLRQATILEVRQAQQSFEATSYTFTNLSFAAKSAEIELNRIVNQIKF
jgi:outer membrane protein TolC